MEFEDNLNHAAGFEDDYREFSRAIFIAWPGNPADAADYMAANKQSKQSGRAFAEVIKQLRNYSFDMEINVIAHSQGNGVLLSAMDYLGEFYRYMKLDNVFLWQAAIPSTALNGLDNQDDPKTFNKFLKYDIQNNRSMFPWYMPFAYMASKKITVLHSNNDNIVGPVIEEEAQPPGVKEADVFKRKPFPEFIAGVFTTYLGLESLYEAANQLGFPASQLLDESKSDKAWQAWVLSQRNGEINIYNKNNDKNETYKLCKNLDEQVELFNKNKILSHLFKIIGKRIKSHEDELKEKLKWIDGIPTSIESSVIYLLKNIDSIEKYLIEDSLDDKTLYKDSSNNIQIDISPFTSFVINQTKNMLFDKYVKKYMPWLIKLITFVSCAEFDNWTHAVKGMGWQGVDKSTVFLLKAKLNVVDCTRWIWHHSDMKIPSKDVMEKIYKDAIIKKIDFGQYPESGTDKK